MKSVSPKLPRLLLGLLLLAAGLVLPGCATDSGESSDSSDRSPRQVEHPNPMGAPSRFTYQ